MVSQVTCQLLSSTVRELVWNFIGELLFVPDDGAVQEFVSQCLHSSFGVSVDLKG